MSSSSTFRRSYGIIASSWQRCVGEELSSSAKILMLDLLVAAVVAALVLALLPSAPADAAPNLPSRFQEKVVISGLNYPTAVEFSKNGKVFVAEQSGIIKVFDNLSDRRPTDRKSTRLNSSHA